MSNQKKLFTLTCLACGVYHALVLSKHYAVSSSTPTLMVGHCSRKYIVENNACFYLRVEQTPGQI